MKPPTSPAAASREASRLALRVGLAAALEIPGESPFDDIEVIIDRLMLDAPKLLPLFVAYVAEASNAIP
jgi:hypothetical protein